MSEATTPPAAPIDENQLILERREKLNTLRERQAQGLGPAFPNDFAPDQVAANGFALYNDKTVEELQSLNLEVKVAGRMMLKCVMGKLCMEFPGIWRKPFAVWRWTVLGGGRDRGRLFVVWSECGASNRR